MDPPGIQIYRIAGFFKGHNPATLHPPPGGDAVFYAVFVDYFHPKTSDCRVNHVSAERPPREINLPPGKQGYLMVNDRLLDVVGHFFWHSRILSSSLVMYQIAFNRSV